MNTKPDMYQKDIHSINYKKLKEKGIKVLLFDFDNTIVEREKYDLSDKTKKLFIKLKKDFIIHIVSNSWNDQKLKKAFDPLGIHFITHSGKPNTKGYKSLNLKQQAKEVAMIGDQVVTDVLGAKRMGYYSILVDPISMEKELIWTRINRIFEKRYMKKDNIKKGDYYE